MTFKSVLIGLLIFFLLPFVANAVVSDETFAEVYTQLELSTETIEIQQQDIQKLTEQVNILTAEIEELSSFLSDTKQKLESAESALNKAKEELLDSNQVITNEKNKNILLGGSIYSNTFKTFGFGAEAGYQIFDNIFATVFLNTNLNEYICGLSCKITI